jgi:hypothetical protein
MTGSRRIRTVPRPLSSPPGRAPDGLGEAGVDEDGAVAAVLAGLVGADGDDLTAAVVEELVRRHRRARAGGAVPLAWQLAGRAHPGPEQAALTALVGFDLPVAVVSACTLLDRPPGPVERDRAERLARRIAEGLGRCGTGPQVPWAEVELLWALRGQPAAADACRADLDLRVARWTLVGGVHPPPAGSGQSPDDGTDHRCDAG